ncbi:MAG: hypothetical protein AABZ33_05420 [Chloroflexota bacterium]
MLPQAPQRRLHFVLQHTAEDIFEPEYATDVPLVRFVAYRGQHRVFGWVRLQADRLTDLLNAHEELALSDVEIEGLDDGATESVDEILIRRSDLIAVHASEPRGDEASRRPTETHPVAMQSGKYLIGGYVHAPPGSDPIASVGNRPLMVPLTDAWIEYWSGGERTGRSSGTIIVNREQVDWMRVVTDRDLAAGLLRPVPIRI